MKIFYIRAVVSAKRRVSLGLTLPLVTFIGEGGTL